MRRHLNWDFVFTGPFFHGAGDVFHLRVGGITQNLQNLMELVPVEKSTVMVVQ